VLECGYDARIALTREWLIILVKKDGLDAEFARETRKFVAWVALQDD
jgi:hypothetical protein